MPRTVVLQLVSATIAATFVLSPPAAAKAKKMSKADWRPSCGKPPVKTVHALTRLPDAKLVQSYSRLKPLGGARFAQLVGVRAKHKHPPRLYLVVMDHSSGQWRADKKLLADYKRLQRTQKTVPTSEDCPDGTRVLVSLYTSDYDHDGWPEIKVRHRFNGCADDDPTIATPLTRLQIFNVAPLRTALDTTIKVGSGPSHYDSWKSRLTHGKDLDGDGHPDLTITFHGEDFANNLGKLYHQGQTRIYHWKAAADRYQLVSTKKRSWVTHESEWGGP